MDDERLSANTTSSNGRADSASDSQCTIDEDLQDLLSRVDAAIARSSAAVSNAQPICDKVNFEGYIESRQQDVKDDETHDGGKVTHLSRFFDAKSVETGVSACKAASTRRSKSGQHSSRPISVINPAAKAEKQSPASNPELDNYLESHNERAGTQSISMKVNAPDQESTADFERLDISIGIEVKKGTNDEDVDCQENQDGQQDSKHNDLDSFLLSKSDLDVDYHELFDDVEIDNYLKTSKSSRGGNEASILIAGKPRQEGIQEGFSLSQVGQGESEEAIQDKFGDTVKSLWKEHEKHERMLSERGEIDGIVSELEVTDLQAGDVMDGAERSWSRQRSRTTATGAKSVKFTMETGDVGGRSQLRENEAFQDLLRHARKQGMAESKQELELLLASDGLKLRPADVRAEIANRLEICRAQLAKIWARSEGLGALLDVLKEPRQDEDRAAHLSNDDRKSLTTSFKIAQEISSKMAQITKNLHVY